MLKKTFLFFLLLFALTIFVINSPVEASMQTNEFMSEDLSEVYAAPDRIRHVHLALIGGPPHIYVEVVSPVYNKLYRGYVEYVYNINGVARYEGWLYSSKNIPIPSREEILLEI